MFAEFGEAADYDELLPGWGRVDFFVFKDPGITVRDEDGVQAGGHRRVDVGFRAVAYHPRGGGHEFIFFNHARVRCSIFLGHDFDIAEIFRDA
jgi:hypothetical protein